MKNNICKYTKNYLSAIVRYYKEKKKYGFLNPHLMAKLNACAASSAKNIPWPTRIHLCDEKWMIISFLYLKDGIEKLNLDIDYNEWTEIFKQGFSNNNKWSELGKLLYNEKKA